MRAIATMIACAAAATTTVTVGPAMSEQREIVIGIECDRTGPTQIVGVNMCPGYQDYINLVNSRGGVEGYVSIMLYGTPQTQALTQKLNEDKIPGTSPGFGTAAAANGARYPYLFPIAATYWSQAAGAVQFIKEKLGGSLEGKKIAYLYFDNPAGHEPMVILDNLKQQEKFKLKEFAVPPPGVEMGAQVLDIAQRFKPDFVIMHLFGRSPSVAIKALKGAGYPLSKVIGMVWASAEADIAAAGGWGAAEGYHTIQFAGVGDDYPVRREIVAWYKAQGKDAPKEMADTVYYNRGLLIAALHVEAIRNALKANGGA